MATPKEHIEEIRREKYHIGGEPTRWMEDLHQTTKLLSAELYTKDIHFLMELIQNAEDNEYLEGVAPSLEFIITSRDITGTGAPSTLLIFNNEKGFSPKNIESICSAGRSTKKGNRKCGYIGEKGIGFKSVFLITSQPYIFSNGYKIRFNEKPCPHCNVGYIVPEWVEENPTLSDINEIYGSGSALPTTTILLPLKPDKVEPVKQQLSSIHPEILLFLSKIKQLSVKEDNEDPNLNTVSSISISSEKNFNRRKNIDGDCDAESYTLHLMDENADVPESKCSYNMWKQKFPVKQENKVERRIEIEQWVITLAFPMGQRLLRGTGSVGVYAFLPTEMVTNFPFIIQADFVLASSRETILLDNEWNRGILDCVPTAFFNAFISLVKMTDDSPEFNLPHMFGFLPIDDSSYPKLNDVKESIRAKLVEEDIIPCESHMGQKYFHKPCEVGRLFPTFWTILNKAKEQGVSFDNLSFHGRYVLNYWFDKEEYDHILNFLGVKLVDAEWYGKCIQSSNLVLGASEDVYLELLFFLATNWGSYFQKTNMTKIPLLKYVGLDGKASLLSIHATRWNGEKMLFQSRKSCHISWLIDWNREFRCVADRFFVPASTQKAILSCSKGGTILEWLRNSVKVGDASVNDYALLLIDSLNDDEQLVIGYAHFLFHSLSKEYLSRGEVDYLCARMPLLDNYGCVTTRRNGVLVPAFGSKWVRLIDSNPWSGEGYVELKEKYWHSGYFAGLFSCENEFTEFLKTYVGASDIPDLSPPDAVIPTLSSPLTKENAFLLLDWIHSLKSQGKDMPEKFLRCIKEGSWLKVSLSGSSGYSPPSQSFLLTSSLGNLLQDGSVIVDIPLIDEGFYDHRINDYKEELKTIGVMFDVEEACKFIGEHLTSQAASSTLTKSNLLSILNFIKFLREKYFSPAEFIRCIIERGLLRTKCGDRSPIGSVLYDEEWKAAKQISDIPFIDQNHYGEEILCYKEELKLLGVVIGFHQNYQLVADCLKSPACLTDLTAEAVLLIFNCMRHSNSSEKFVPTLKDEKFLKTDIGYKSPSECFLYDPEWGSLLQVFDGFPLIDQNFYGSPICSYKDELRQTGVTVDSEVATKAVARVFRQKASSSSIKKENVLLFLACYGQLKSPPKKKIHSDLKKCIREEKWLRTCIGYRSPKECILFGPDWESISPIARLPFIDYSDDYFGKGFHEYKEVLKGMRVVLDFKDGVKFVASGLSLPQNLNAITPATVLSLLKCVRILLQEQKGSLPEDFLKEVSQTWLKTHAGYRSPDKCMLFDSRRDSFLQQTDGPFIDQEFYGSDITSYREELNAIGVSVAVTNVCQLLASHLDLHSKFSTIDRIYNFLREKEWEPDSDASRRIWIPNGSDNGEWVSPGECVLHDKDDLFGSQLNVLKKYYEPKLLNYFSSAFEVKSHPLIDDYYKIWKVWESSGGCLSQDECCAFWSYVTKNWSENTKNNLADNLAKLPVYSESGGILLVNKHDVFLADDLQLKDIFEHSFSHPIFVWYPQSSLLSLSQTKLLEIYREIGVPTISKSVQKQELSIGDAVEVELKQVNPGEIFIGKVLVRLILSFLADPFVQMEPKKRHEVVKGLLNVTVFETVEPITVSYSLSLSSGEIVTLETSQSIGWKRENSKLFTQKMDRSGGHRNIIEYATNFSEVLSRGVLWEKEHLIDRLCDLIEKAFLLEFDEEAVGYLMKRKNLQIFAADEEFLSSVFPSHQISIVPRTILTHIDLVDLGS